MATYRRNEYMGVDFNVFVNGFSLIGITTEVSIPDIEMTGVESDSSSAGKLTYYYGAVENMELEFTVGGVDPLIHYEMAKLNSGKIRLKEALSQGKINETTGVEFEIEGQISSISGDKMKRGEKKEVTIKMGSIHVFIKRINGIKVCEIDKPRGICRPDGITDVLAHSRNYVTS